MIDDAYSITLFSLSAAVFMVAESNKEFRETRYVFLGEFCSPIHLQQYLNKL